MKRPSKCALSLAGIALVFSTCMPAGLASTGIAIEPRTVVVAVTEETDRAAVQSGGAPFGQGTVRWSVDPIELGTVDARGHSTAGPPSGTGSVTASLGTLSATAHVTVSCPTSRSVRDIAFDVWCTDSADLYVEARLAGDDAAAVAALAESDTAAVQKDLARAFRTRALIYVFADTSSYLPGVRRIFGERTGATAVETDAFFAPWVDAIAVDWREISRDVPITGLRHELTHRLVWQVAGSSFDVFTTAFAQRMRAAVTPYPGITAAPRARQSVLMLYGFTPGSLVTFSVSGPASLTSVERMDEYGNGLLVLGSGYPVGSYSVGVLGGDGKLRPMYAFTK